MGWVSKRRSQYELRPPTQYFDDLKGGGSTYDEVLENGPGATADIIVQLARGCYMTEAQIDDARNI